jgi:hypothetical protein
MNVDVCTSLPITTAMSRLDLRIGVSLPGPLRRAGPPRPEPETLCAFLSRSRGS